MGIATEVESAIDTLLNTFVSTKSAAISAALAPLALTGVSIYIIVMGWAIMRGEAHDSFHTFLWKSFKIAMIVGVALSAGEYQGTVVDGIQGIQGAFVQAFGNATTIGGLVDNMAQPYDDLGQQLWSEATTGFWPNFTLLVAAALVALAQSFLFIVGLGLYLLAKVALALVLAVGPAFIFCAMFPATQRFTESWLGQALTFILLNVLIGGSIAMLTSFASQFAQHIQANLGTTAIIKDTVALLTVSGALGVVMLNLNTIASALSGGASISGIGRAIGRKAMDMMSRDKKPDSPTSKNGGGSINQGSGSNAAGGGGSQPLYQRNVLDNIRRAA
ncbi:MAG: hypothetical protein C0607_03645 [Azoarcus sp.]|nr:MAG: hypothetical protein C0607_03645 [Azoarcus sp.]TVT60050.1 MAG: type IV secretion system protein [Azoarcus sp. PHD]